MKSKIAILYSYQNNVWTSMQEIVPLIKEQWSFEEDEDIDYTFINCDNETLGEISKKVLNADILVISIFNANIAKVATFCRKDLGIDAPWVIYLHGQATIGMWPLSVWKMAPLFKQSDYFIGTCEGDRNSLSLAFPKANYFHGTFSYQKLKKGIEIKVEKKSHSFIYIGRVSPQKLLHQLIWAYSLSDNKETDLHIFGEEDHLGSPNMGVEEKNYLNYLKNLSKKLKVDKQVIFHGFTPRENIHTSLKSWNHTLVFPGVHSDENLACL